MSKHPRPNRERRKPKGYGAKPRPPKSNLPPGAILADPTKHTPNNGWIGFTHYVDFHGRCVECGAEFTFTARQQKHWYETLKGTLYSTAKRCAACRRRAREAKAVQREQMAAAEAKRATKPQP